MLIEMSSKFEQELYMVKGILLDDDKTVIHGYLDIANGEKTYIKDLNNSQYEINPYTLCRNTGIKKENEWIYEFDLVEYRRPVDDKVYLGYIVFNTFSNEWAIRTSLNYSSVRSIKNCGYVKPIGNILLSNNDCNSMQEFSDKEDESYTPNTEPECRSTQYLNRKAKEFLPR